MLLMFAVMLIVLWLMGLVSTYMGGFINVVPVVAILLVLIRIIQGRRVT